MDREVKFCQGKDIFERINYLYQASNLISEKNVVAASYYGNVMIGCARKAVLRIESNIKRTICKCCQSPLVPGRTARVRLISKPIKAIKWTCLICMVSKKYPTKKGFKLWADQTNSVVQTLDYASPKSINDKKKSKTKEKKQ